MDRSIFCVIRRCRFAPYIKGMGPSFGLTIWDTYETMGPSHHSRLAYRLTMAMPGKRRIVLFEGSDFGCPQYQAVDSDETVASIMGFLTLRPGDTDRDYFAGYTEAQLDYAECYAESLAMVIYARYGER